MSPSTSTCTDITETPNSIGTEKALRWSAHNIKSDDLKRIERMIAENTDIIINRWYELFKFKTNNEDNQ